MASLELLQEDISVPDDVVRERNKLVSVVIPTYNRAELTECAIRSVLSQTYVDLEVIIVDDASTDDTRERVKALQQVDHRILYFRHDSKRGAQAARNTGIRMANGNYMAFLDSDNEWLPRKLELQMKLFSHRTDHLGVVYCGIKNETGDNKFFGEHFPKYHGYIYPIVLRDWIADTSTLVVRKDYLEKVGGFDESIRAYQEWDISIRLARVAEFDYVEDILAIYHEHAGVTISKDLLQNAWGYLDVINAHYHEILANVGRQVLSNHFYQTGRIFMRAGEIKKARACFSQAIKFNPSNVRAWAHLFISLLGIVAYSKALSFARKQPLLRSLKG